MSMSKFFKEAVAYRLGGGHLADHKAMNVATYATNPLTGGVWAMAGTGQTFPLSPWSPSLYNFSPANYPRTRKALALLRTGVRFNVWCLGDSTTAGGYAGNVVNAIAASWPRYLSDMLTSMGIQSGWQNFNGDHNQYGTGSLQQIDARVTLGAGWAPFIDAGYCIGGYALTNATNQNAITFAPTVPTDTLDIFYLDVGGSDSITVGSGAAGATTPTTGGTVAAGTSSTIKKATATYTLGSNVWSIKKATANTAGVWLQGLVAYNSAVPEVQLLNCGVPSKKLDFLADETYYFNPRSAILLAQNATNGNPLAIINFGINDWLNGTSPASFYATLTAQVTAYISHGTEVLLIAPIPSNPANASLAAQSALIAKIYQVALENNCAVIDITKRWGSYSAASAIGYYADTLTHPTPFGYADFGMAVKQFFMAL